MGNIEKNRTSTAPSELVFAPGVQGLPNFGESSEYIQYIMKNTSSRDSGLFMVDYFATVFDFFVRF